MHIVDFGSGTVDAIEENWRLRHKWRETLTRSGLRLSRVSLVDPNLRFLGDKLVEKDGTQFHYLEKIAGISEQVDIILLLHPNPGIINISGRASNADYFASLGALISRRLRKGGQIIIQLDKDLADKENLYLQLLRDNLAGTSLRELRGNVNFPLLRNDYGLHSRRVFRKSSS